MLVVAFALFQDELFNIINSNRKWTVFLILLHNKPTRKRALIHWNNFPYDPPIFLIIIFPSFLFILIVSSFFRGFAFITFIDPNVAALISKGEHVIKNNRVMVREAAPRLSKSQAVEKKEREGYHDRNNGGRQWRRMEEDHYSGKGSITAFPGDRHWYC